MTPGRLAGIARINRYGSADNGSCGRVVAWRYQARRTWRKPERNDDAEFILQAVVTALGLWLSAYLVPGVAFLSTGSLIAAAVILASLSLRS